MNLESLTDSELIALFKSDQEQAFKEIYDRYWLRLLQTAYRKTDNREAAEEMVQDLFINLWQRRSDLQINRSLESYLLTAVKYRVINFIHRQVVIRQQEKMRPLQVLRGNDTEEQIHYRELNEQLSKAIHKLPAKSRAIFEMSRYENYSNKHIAGKLRISEKAVEYHITRSLKLLRSYLKGTATLLILAGIL